MKPMLCRCGKTLRLKKRWFKVFIDCTIEHIHNDVIMVSDYVPTRDKPVNMRSNTCEVMEITGMYDPGRLFKGASKTEVEVLSQYTECLPISDAKGKCVAAANEDGLIVFTDKSYIPASEIEDDYDGSCQVFLDLTIENLKRLELLDSDTLNKIRGERQQLLNIQRRLDKDFKVDKLRRTADAAGFTLVEKIGQ